MAWCKHKESQLRTLGRDRYEITELSNNILCGWEIITKEECTIVTNLSLMDSKDIETIKDTKLFFVDSRDIESYYRMHEQKMDVKEISMVFSSLKRCTKHHFKNIYIRTLPVPLASIQQKKEPNEEHGKVVVQREEHRIFVDDVMAVIPLILSRQQSKNTKWTDKKLKTYYEKWQSGNEHVESSIPISQFVSILAELDCDKSQIILFEDPMHELSRNEMAEEFGFVRTCAPNLKVVMDGPQAIFFVFHNLVNGINWRNEKCTDHENCNKTLKTKILNFMYYIGGFKPGAYISVQHLITETDKIKDSCPAKYRTPRETNDFIFQGIVASTHTHVEYYYKVVMEYNLILLDVGLPMIDMNFFQVFSFRFLLQFGWVIQFFTEDEDVKLRLCVIHSALNLIPEHYWQKGMQIAYHVLSQTKAVLDQWKARGKPEENEESLEGPLPGMKKNVRPADRAAPGGPPPLFIPDDCCSTCMECLKETKTTQMNALVVQECSKPYESELQKLPALLELSEQNVKKIAELKKKIAEKERNRKPTHAELKAKNEEFLQAEKQTMQRMDSLTAEKRVLLDIQNNIKKTNDELTAKKGDLETQANSRKENKPTMENVEEKIPTEILEKEKKIAELQNTHKNLTNIVESQSIYIQEMAK